MLITWREDCWGFNEEAVEKIAREDDQASDEKGYRKGGEDHVNHHTQEAILMLKTMSMVPQDSA